MDATTQHRKKRLEQLIKAAPYNGDRAVFMEKAQLTKGRISQLLDPTEAFGELSARRLCETLDLPDGWFDHGAPGKPMAWPFVLLTQKQAASLNSANRGIVENLALQLLSAQQKASESDVSYSENVSPRSQVQPGARRAIPVKRVAFRTPGVEEDREKRSKPEGIRSGKSGGR